MFGAIDVSRYLDQKYANQGLMARSQAAENFAKAGLIGEQAQQVAPTAAVERDFTGARAGLTGAQTAQTSMATQLMPREVAAREEQARASVLSARASQSRADDYSSYQRLMEDLMRQKNQPSTGYAKGTARVPGKGDGTKDTVKAKLAPGEAVLNKAAAEGMGRGLIAALNKMGAKKMGML